MQRDEANQTTTLDATRVKHNDTLVFKGCRNGQYTIEALHTKLVIDSCTDCKFLVKGKVVSAVCDMYKCENIDFQTDVAIKTLQVDNCLGVKTQFSRTDAARPRGPRAAS